jgi:leucyl aminopeptidase
MQTTLKKSTDPLSVGADAIVVFVAEPAVATGTVAAADAALDGLVGACIADGEITGEVGQISVIHTGGLIGAPRLVVVGVGDGSIESWRAAGRATGARVRAIKARTVALAIDDADGARLTALVTGVRYGAYRFDRYKTSPPDPELTDLRVYSVVVSPAQLRRATRLADAVSAARDLANAPANDLTPTALAARAAELADQTTGLECTVLERKELQKLGAGALLAVAQGSDEPPKMIVLRYTPKRRAMAGEVLGLVGKAVTFDTGGISIKPSGGMEEMKLDMAGGAAVVEAIGLIAQLALSVEVVAVVPATENMPSGTATRPGDVVRAMNGKTIEVINTDAEGRLILADALTYAATEAGATRLVDFATLTGAIVVALGEVYAGLFGSDDDWTAAVRAAGEASGELCWPMPLHPGYAPLITSKVADLSNAAAKRQAGAVYAAQFLREFTDGRPWCHVDIAGTGMIGGAGTGFGVGLMLAIAEQLAHTPRH